MTPKKRLGRARMVKSDIFDQKYQNRPPPPHFLARQIDLVLENPTRIPVSWVPPQGFGQKSTSHGKTPLFGVLSGKRAIFDP